MTPGDRLRELIRETGAKRSGSPGAVPIATVSGVAATTRGMVSWFDQETTVTMITSKSLQLRPNPGNREPIITEPHPGDYGNAVGLRNPGIEVAVEEFTELRRRGGLNALLAVSLSAVKAEDFVVLARRSRPVADVLELNYSCPHAAKGYGADIGRDAKAIETITAAVVAVAEDLPVVVKLTPNVPNIAEMAMVAVAAGAAGVSAINTVGPEIYVHPESGTPILSNPPDGRGGKSGRWIREDAIEAITAIRETIGPSPVIVGMGGVSDRSDVERFVSAGADIVGVGSALGGVHQRDWPEYISSLARRGRSVAVDSSATNRRRRAAPGMEPRRHEVTARRELGDDLYELDVTPPVDAAIGQTVFLWIPGIGEKPFAPAVTENGTTTFVIKRRGAFTAALGARKAGDDVYVRGPYGDPWVPPAPVVDDVTAVRETALLIAAGSGIATLPLVARGFIDRDMSVTSLVGVRTKISRGRVTDALADAGTLEIVPDDGQIGRVLTRVQSVVTARERRVTAVWICGPEAFMSVAAAEVAAGAGVNTAGAAAEAAAPAGAVTDVTGKESATMGVAPTGIPKDRVFLSLERMMRCGVGLCGECHNEGRLTCQFGTVVTAGEVRL